MEDTGVDLVTGAFSYSGSHIASRLLRAGRSVRTLTDHPRGGHPLADWVETWPYRFDDPAKLVRSFTGVTTFYNTYWVRFPRRGVTFLDAVARSQLLFEAAALAGVQHVVHISIANADITSPWGYFQGKALTERILGGIGLPHSIVRPTVVFGGGDVLINNIAWLLRRFPAFAIPGDGGYRVRPVHVEDVACLCVTSAVGADNRPRDAVGPETLTFWELVNQIRVAIGSRSRMVSVPPFALPVLAKGIGLAIGDVLLTAAELGGLRDELVTTSGPATGTVAFSAWLGEHAETLGRRYASEVRRHYTAPFRGEPRQA